MKKHIRAIQHLADELAETQDQLAIARRKVSAVRSLISGQRLTQFIPIGAVYAALQDDFDE